MSRLEDEISWYDRKSNYNQLMFKILKGWTFSAAAFVPVLAGFEAGTPKVLAAITATIAVSEGIQHLNQYHANWLSYRATAEALKHEKYLFLAASGPYAVAEAPGVHLAERIEELVSTEHAKWTSVQEQAGQAGRKDSTRTN